MTGKDHEVVAIWRARKVACGAVVSPSLQWVLTGALLSELLRYRKDPAEPAQVLWQVAIENPVYPEDPSTHRAPRVPWNERKTLYGQRMSPMICHVRTDLFGSSGVVSAGDCSGRGGGCARLSSSSPESTFPGGDAAWTNASLPLAFNCKYLYLQ